MAINRDKVLEAAQKYVEKKKYDKAILEYRRLIEADPNDARTLLKIGDLQAKQGTYPDAISTYETVGKLYAQQGFALKAIAVYKQIRELIAKHVPQLEERYGHITPKLAELYQQLGLTSDALAALDEVATRLQRQQRDGEALDVFRRIVELDPTNPLPHLRLAEALSRIRDVDGAVAEFKTAAAQLANIGRRDDALKVLERLLHHKQDAEQARFCAELYLSRGQPQDGMQALSKLQVCFQANPRDFDTLSLLARAFTAIGQGTKAIEVQKEMARVARDTGKQDLFREIVERLLRVAPHDEGVRKLAMQSGSAVAQPPQPPTTPWGAAPPPAAARAPAPQPQAHQPAPATQAYPPAAASQPGARPGTQPLQRPFAAPPAPAYEVEEVEEEAAEEIGYDEVEDVEADAYEADAYGSQEGGGFDSVTSRARDPYHTSDVETDQAAQSARLETIVADANAFRRVRLFQKAIDTVGIGLEIDPRAMELRELRRDLLIESNRTELAVEEMLVIAGLFVDALDGESAARALQDVLAFDPQNARAIEMLQELGYEIVDEGEADGGEQPAQAEANAPLPSYDLEEVGPADVSSEYDDRQLQRRASAEELPSFPLEEQDAYAEVSEGELSPEEAALLEAGEGYAEEAAPPAAAMATGGGGSAQELEDALDEAEFFASRGLLEDAQALLAEHLQRHPNHPLLLERIAELEAQAAERASDQQGEVDERESGAREKPQDRAFDIAASLDALETLDYDLEPAEGFANQESQIDVEEVFAKFKEGVAKQISVDDSASHYDLGIAYKEMMLIDDAIREFEVAARDPQRECVCRSMIGMIHIERGDLNAAIQAFEAGLAAPMKDPQQETVLCYELGAAYEGKKLLKEALSYFQKAMRRDPNYRDVQERVRRLAKNEPAKPALKAAAGADDEFDRAFDDLLGKA